MKNNSIKTMIGVACILLAAVLFVAPALAQSFGKTIDVIYRDIKIYIDGSLVVPKDASGRIVEPFIHNGTTYLPARAISEALGKTVEWDGVNNNIYIGELVSQDIVEIAVSTAEEFVAALGSNRRILLNEGLYNLSEVSPAYINSSNVSFIESYDGVELTLNGVHNLTIQGAGKNKSELVITPRYAFVMKFEDCSNIAINNIKAGHTPERGYCAGGVFSFEDSMDIQIDNTDMYGCGTVGLHLALVANMKVTNSTVYDCTEGIVAAYNCAKIMFKDCVFKDNHAFTMVKVWMTHGFSIDSCEFSNNSAEYYPDAVFSVEGSYNVAVTNTLFENNAAAMLFEQSVIELDESNTFKNNTFTSK